MILQVSNFNVALTWHLLTQFTRLPVNKLWSRNARFVCFSIILQMFFIDFGWNIERFVAYLFMTGIICKTRVWTIVNVFWTIVKGVLTTLSDAQRSGCGAVNQGFRSQANNESYGICEVALHLHCSPTFSDLLVSFQRINGCNLFRRQQTSPSLRASAISRYNSRLWNIRAMRSRKSES